MTLITIWLDGIDEKWGEAALDVGFDDQRLYAGTSGDATRCFSEKGALVYRKLTALPGVSVYMPAQYNDPGGDRCLDRVVVRRNLQLYHGGGYARDLKRFLSQIANGLGGCNLGASKIQYFVSEELLCLLGPCADAIWPTGLGEHPAIL